MRLHHIGIATEDTRSIADTYGGLLELSICHEEVVDTTAVTFLELPNGYLELLEPVDEGPIERFLDRHGPGLHHLAFETDDIVRSLENAAANGVGLIDDEPRRGAWGHDIAFLHPDSMGGVLVEFVEVEDD